MLLITLVREMWSATEDIAQGHGWEIGNAVMVRSQTLLSEIGGPVQTVAKGMRHSVNWILILFAAYLSSRLTCCTTYNPFRIVRLSVMP